MSRICLLVDQFLPPTEPARAAAAADPWALASAFASGGEDVTIIDANFALEGTPAGLPAAARSRDLGYVALRETPPAFAVPLFPQAESHTRAHHAARLLGELTPEVCIVLGSPALAAIALLRRQTGGALASTRFVVLVSNLPRELARLAQDDLPLGGREEIVHDYLERRALSAADAVIFSDRAVLARVVDAGLVSAASARQLETLSDSTAWRPYLVPAPAHPAPRPLPRVSVCLPYYEQPDFLADALASLAAQTLPPHEVILMDDGSKSPAALRAYAEAEKRYATLGWRFLHQPNAGPAAARNRLVEHATGDAVLFCDTDNRFRPEMVATLARALAMTGADCVTCAFATFSDPVDPADPGYVLSPLGGCVELGLIENVLGDTNFLVRRSVFLEQGGFSAERLADEDWQFLLQLLRHGGRVETVPDVLFDYRRLATSRARRQGEFASAVITLAPVLAQTDPAWRRLWPHLVASVRNPRVPQLEHQLRANQLKHQAELATLQQAYDSREHQHRAEIAAREQQHRADLDRERHLLALARADLRRRHWEIVVQKSAVEQARAATAAAEGRHADEIREAAVREQALAGDVADREQRIRTLEDKLRRMQASWSWQATAPARALRRQLVDPFRRAPKEDASAAAPAPEFRLAVDRPAFWDAAPASGVISGWCLGAGQRPTPNIRVLLDGTPLPGTTGQSREDVAQAHGLAASAAGCGFEFHYRLAADTDHALRVEVQADDGSWQVAREGTLHTTSRPRAVHDYASWVECFSTVTPDKAAALRERLAALPATARPLLSVLMPVHNAPERWLERAVESVRAQVYENWELCIADDASTAAHVRPLLERLQAADSRIRVTFRPRNGHISAASNSALELVRGEFVALLDHDDELPSDALAEVALLLAAQPETDLVFSDEDKIDEDGRRRDPYFKPDFLPDLLLGQNCLSHLSVYRTALVREVGGFRVGYEGSQDWDLALRVVDRTTPERVRHLPKVLYHWRAISGSTAVTVSAKNYSVDAARRALCDHFARRGIAAEVRPVPGDHWQIVYPLPHPAPLVSIIIPTRNACALLRTCVGSILARTEYPNFEVIVVNNRSDDPETLAFFEELRREDNVRTVDFDAPFNFSAINNHAVRAARGEVLCFLNNDIEVITGRWLDELASHALRPEIGAVGAMLYYPNNTIQHAGVVLGLGGVANHAFLHYRHGTDGYMNRARLAQNYSAVTAACLAVRREVFARVGGFDAEHLAVAFNDIDLCLRIRAAGYRNLWTPFAELYHHESASRGSDHDPAKQARFTAEIEHMRRTWGPQLDRDPAYNPNLTLDLLGWALAWPPRA
ncbi:glycosyltransferase [Opitutus sp. ER46]|uniref:glycosyltransferase n=1 Tax=Opitutus sp. ER46 TaxID=2161864 RepID=UPI000D3160F7|nr:glycosyltransferase [Opitutus sp. ER46]PTX92589.1 hypothetical protein DB354_14780 [Opitutus sp. ER46]